MRNVALISAVLLSLMMLAVCGLAVNTAPSGQFNVTENVSFNWSMSTINVTSNYTSLSLSVSNATNSIQPSYFSSTDYPVGSYNNMTSENAVICVGTGGTPGAKFFVKNSSGDFIDTTILNNGQYELFQLGIHTFCPPGKYYGNFSVQNASNTSDHANVTATMNVPISTNNTLGLNNKTAFFKGNLTSGYHSYYFWTNASSNTTTVTINLTGVSGNLDIFLINSQDVQLNRSTNQGTTNETMISIQLPVTPDIWELRLGNSTSSYFGYLYFSTLNSTNQTLSFGSLVPNQSTTFDYNITNLAPIELANVTESKEVYRVTEFANINDSSDFLFLVPAFARRVEATIVWNNETGKNMTNWNVYLRDGNNTLLGSSTENSSAARGLNTTAAETVLYTGSISTSNDGLWNFSVVNATNGSLCYYNVTFKVWMNSSEWLSTNFNTSTFNQSGLPNSTYNLTANLTVPRWNLTSGNYRGFVHYSNGSGWIYSLPVSFTVNAGTLLVNNNVTNTTYTWEDNMGINRTGSETLRLNISVNNTGNYPIYFAGTSSGSLLNTGNTTRYMNFSVDWPTNPVAANANTSILVNISINTTQTGNLAGTYRGWVAFNTSNSTLNSSSYPYEMFNLTVDVNLSSELIVNITAISPTLLLNASQQNNITITSTVKLKNGTIISNTGIVGDNNFTSVVLTEKNVTSYYNSTSTIAAADVTTCAAGVCRINATVPASMVGGNYTVTLYAMYSTGQSNLTGSSNYSSVVINESGLSVVSVAGTSLALMDEATTRYVNFTVTNYGGMTAPNTQIAFNKGTCPITVTTHDSSCSASESAATFTSTINANGTQCWYRWKVVASNVSSSTTCTGMSVTIANRKTFNNATGLTLSVNNLETVTTTTGTTGSACTTNSDCASNYRCSGGSCSIIECTSSDKHIVDHACVSYNEKVEAAEYENLSIALGGSTETTVMVKNTGDATVRAKLAVVSVEGIDYTTETSTYSLNNDCPLTPGSYCYFKVKFFVGNTTALGNHLLYYKAHVTNKMETNTLKPVYIEVLATEERKANITSLYTEYLSKITELREKVRLLRLSGIPETNLSKVDILINETQTDIINAKAAIDTDDYAEAESLLNGANSSFARITGMLTEMGGDDIKVGLFGLPSTTWLIIIGAGIGIIVVAVVIYMFLPPKGYTTTYKDYTAKKSNIKEKITGNLKKLKPKKDNKYKYKFNA